MIDLDEIRDEIAILEHGDTSWSACEKLHILYEVLEHFEQPTPTPRQAEIPEYSAAAEPASEFVKAASGVPFDKLMNVLDEHMDAVRTVFPKEYAEVLRMIRAIK